MANEQSPPLDREGLGKLEAAFVDLLDYWYGKRAGRGMPRRADIDPVELRGHLGSLLLLDIVEPLEASCYRLIGTQIVDAAGRDSTNKPIGELYSEPLRGWLLGVYRSILGSGVPHVGWGRWMVGNYFLNVRSLFLPLSEDDSSVTMVLVKLKFEPAAQGLDAEALRYAAITPPA